MASCESAPAYQEPEEINDTHKHFLDLRDRFYGRIRPRSSNLYGGMGLPHAVILEAQLLEMTDDKQSLRNELEELIRERLIRAFELEISSFLPERYFVLEIDYQDQLGQMQRPVVDKFLKGIIPSQTSSRISKETLLKAEFTETEIKDLVDALCLLIQDGSIYLLSLPLFGGAKASIIAGRRFLVRYLSSRPGRTQTRSEMERRTIDESVFYAEFHCQELIGLGVFEVMKRNGRPEQFHLVYDPYRK